MEEPTGQYVKGFNHGYELQKHEPNLLNQLLNASNPKSDYFQGLKDGRKQMEKEIGRNDPVKKMREKLDRDRDMGAER